MPRPPFQFADAECAKKALEQLNGFELAGRPMKVGHVTERSDSSTASSFLDNDELERTGIDLGTTGRLQLMARLAEGSPSASSRIRRKNGNLCAQFLKRCSSLTRNWAEDSPCSPAGPSNDRLHAFWEHARSSRWLVFHKFSICFLFDKFVLRKKKLTFFFVHSCPYSSSKPSSEPAVTALGHSLPSAVQPLQPTIVRLPAPRLNLLFFCQLSTLIFRLTCL